MNREEGEKRRNLREIQKRLNRKKKTGIGKEERNDNEKEKKRKKKEKEKNRRFEFQSKLFSFALSFACIFSRMDKGP